MRIGKLRIGEASIFLNPHKTVCMFHVRDYCKLAEAVDCCECVELPAGRGPGPPPVHLAPGTGL